MVRAALLVTAALGLPRAALACAPADAAAPLCGVVQAPCPRRPHVLVLSAFPAEQRALRAATHITERVALDGRSVVVGRLAGQPVVLALTGIGLVNATATTEALLARFDVGAIVFSGVAGSGLRIGDVAVPARWTDTASGRVFEADAGLLRAARAVADHPPPLERCTALADPPGATVCLPFAPRVVVGGAGESGDPFGGTAFPCMPGAGDVFGCEVTLAVAQAAASPADATDMETAAVAAVAAAHGVPLVAVRGVSDGTGDPLGLPGFPRQFFAYYGVAADNAAAVVIRLLAALPPAVGAVPVRRPARAAASCGFERVASADCRGGVSGRVARLVARACGLAARAGGADPRAVRRARAAWQRAAAVAQRTVASSCCATALGARLRAAADGLTPSSSRGDSRPTARAPRADRR